MNKSTLKLFTLVIVSMLVVSCLSKQRISSKNEGIIIEIESVENFKSIADYQLNISISNNSEDEIYIPVPIDEWISKYKYFPEFFNIRFTNLYCDEPIDIIESVGKQIANFKNLKQGDKLLIKLNPSSFMTSMCEKESTGPYTAQLIYAPSSQIFDEQIVESKFQSIEDKSQLVTILSKIPMDTLYSNIFTLNQIK